MNDQTPPDNQPVFHVERVYLKDLSFESPHTPGIFAQQQGEPSISMEMEAPVTQVGDNLYTVDMAVTVELKQGDKTIFLVEVKYGGLFLLRNIPKEHMEPLLNVECPSLVFPYVRQVISNVVSEGGFRPVVLDPVNFGALYQQKMAEMRAGAGAPPAEPPAAE